ncbi:hypothetical protein [Actinokineospora pegani]|uniref:hypothetical protein n=1 Tax=Actinokineospora pegani TaxID=2654637 RepID=UPI0012EAF4BE|nr:hypothetical protein [Actinokineospora pegani]
MPDKDEDQEDLLDRSTEPLAEYAEADTRERTPVVGKDARAEDARAEETTEPDPVEAPD